MRTYLTTPAVGRQRLHSTSLHYGASSFFTKKSLHTRGVGKDGPSVPNILPSAVAILAPALCDKLRALIGKEFSWQHSGAYIDRATKKTREFDIRATGSIPSF
jgi:hypothetical protein